MAIEPLKKVTVVSPKEAGDRLIKVINSLGVMEVHDIRDSLEENIPFTQCRASTEEADENLHKIDFILNLINSFAPERESFVRSLTPLPIVTSPKELDTVLSDYGLEEHYLLAREVDEIYRRAERVAGEIEAELDELYPISDLPFHIADFSAMRRVGMAFGSLPKKSLAALDEMLEPWPALAWEEIGVGGKRGGDTAGRSASTKDEREHERLTIVLAFLQDDGEEVRRALVTAGFEEIQFPRRQESVTDRIRELEGDLSGYRSEMSSVVEQVRLLSSGSRMGEGRRALLVLRAYWSNIRNRQVASRKGVEGRWVHIVSGYVRVRDVSTLVAVMDRDFSSSVVTIEDPGPYEDVPVSLSVPHLLRPIQLLTEMFGLPRYKGFDPTPFMQLSFYAFFGICFSDAGYGVMLILLGSYLMKKTKSYAGVYDFSRILLYGGISSLVFGVLLGSWFGDLYKPEYLGDNNFLLLFQKTLTVLDPIQKTIIALILALGIGVLNQFFGIALRMYGAARQRDWMGVFSDGICWILTLTGLLMMVGKVFGPIPPAIFTTGLWLFCIGALGLVLTQGRESPSIAGRIATGLVSLYGIVGAYGITAFVGDTLSYCRLLALGLTTSIIAMALNLMAGMVKDVPYIGTVLFIVILVVGHLFNFFISALGAFVHSMRLIFVEFFGRFYETGGRRFQPLGFDSDTCVMQKNTDEWNGVQRAASHPTGIAGTAVRQS